MNIEHLRRALKSEWLSYYRQNRHWIVRLGVWVNCQEQRRPSASFILGTLSTLNPQLIQLLPLVVDLNSNPDRIVMALGLNFNPEEELEGLTGAELPPVIAQQPTFDQKAANQKVAQEIAPTPEKEIKEIAPSEKKGVKMLASSDDSPSTSVEPSNHRRTPLDTAQLSARELPDRGVAKSGRGDRNRKKARLD